MKLYIVKLTILFGRKLEDVNKNTLYQMKDTKTRQYSRLIWRLRKCFEERSNDDLE
jgi:hypothetical protein